MATGCRSGVGELCIRGPYVMQRYYKRSREECFDADGWFHTGDLVRTDADGFVYFVGRRGAMIKTAGANVSPAEVEKAIAKVTGGARGSRRRHPGRRARAAGRRGRRAGQTAPRSTRRRCVERLTAELSAYKIPKRFIALPHAEIPLLSSGKVDRAATEEAVRCLTPRTIDQLVRSRAAQHGAKPMVIDPDASAQLPRTRHHHKRFGRGVRRGRGRQGHPGRADHAQRRPLGADRHRADPHRRRAGSAEHPAAAPANWSRNCGPRRCNS